MDPELHGQGFWEVHDLRTARGLFTSLPDLLPEDSVLYLEETSMDRGLQLYLEEHGVPPGLEIEPGTLSPSPRSYHVPIRPALMAEVQDIADRVAVPQVCDHLHAYRGDDLLITWHDAWVLPLLVSRSVPGKRMAVLCRRVEVPHVPRPFNYRELRDTMPAGYLRRYRVSGPDGLEGHREWTVLYADAAGAEIENRELDAEGAVIGEPNIGRSEWTELESHATFPANATTIDDVDRETPAGTFPCLLYTVFGEERGVGVLHRFWFAKNLPGAPVEFECFRDGELVFRHTLTEVTGA